MWTLLVASSCRLEGDRYNVTSLFSILSLLRSPFYWYQLHLNYAAVNCKTHYRTPGNSASWMGHLPHISDERYRLGSFWSVTTLTNECVNDGHFTWVRPFPMTYDTVVGGILKSRHAKCVRSAWPVCIDSVARCGSSTTCASMELARCGSSATCASMELQSFPCV